MKLNEKSIDRKLVPIKQIKVGQVFVDTMNKKCMLIDLKEENKLCTVMYLDPNKSSGSAESRNKDELVQRVAILEISYKAWPLKDKVENNSGMHQIQH